jgi:progesterone-induced-blocking factor 1
MTDFSKSELFELSAELSSDSTQLSIGPLEFSNFDFDDDMEQVKLKKAKARKQEIELKQLQHDLQLSRIQLAQKEYELNNMRVEYTTKTESLEEKVHELTHQNQLLNTRLQSIVNIHQEEEKQRQEQIKVELSRILVRQKELEENNERFMKNERELKKELRNIDTVIWTNDEYEFMCRRDEDLMTIKEYATLKLYNCIRPLKQKLDECYKQIQTLEEQLKQEKNETTRLKQVSAWLNRKF